MTDSRGVGLQKFLYELLPEGSKECTEVHINSGKGYKVMREKALALLPPPYRQRSRSHVYFVCGICDITEMFRSPTQNYKETVMVLSPEAVFEKVAAEINDCRQAILKAGALPIFATIPRINLAIYNNYVLNHPKPEKRTSLLLHSKFYPDMQTRTNKAVDKINKFICETNRQLGNSIPFLHTDIMKRCGSNKTRVYYKYLWGLYYDGLHADEDLKKKWAGTLSIAIGHNRSKDDEDVCLSPKRSWMHEEKRPRLK